MWRCLGWWKPWWTTLALELAAWMETRYRKCFVYMHSCQMVLIKCVCVYVCVWVAVTHLCLHMNANMDSCISERSVCASFKKSRNKTSQITQSIGKERSAWFWKPNDDPDQNKLNNEYLFKLKKKRNGIITELGAHKVHKCLRITKALNGLLCSNISNTDHTYFNSEVLSNSLERIYYVWLMLFILSGEKKSPLMVYAIQLRQYL